MTIEHPGRARIRRMMRQLASTAMVILVLGPTAAQAVCGDGHLDPGELCDDGNLADGDCCSSTCQRPTGCFATDRSGIIIHDQGDNRLDMLSWRYFRGPTDFADWGDPTDATSYSFCVWDDDELKIQAHIDAGGICLGRKPCWKTLGRGAPQAFQFYDKPFNEWGIDRVLLAIEKPPADAIISLEGVDVNLPLPGPVAYDRYFNQQTAVTVQFVRSDSPVCWEAAFPTALQSNYKRFRALIYPAP